MLLYTLPLPKFQRFSSPVSRIYCQSVLNFLPFYFSDVYHQHSKSQRNKACKTCSVFGLNVLSFPYWNQQSSRVSKSLVRCNSRICNWNIYSSVFGKCIFVSLLLEKYQYIGLYILASISKLDFSDKEVILFFKLSLSLDIFTYIQKYQVKGWSNYLFWLSCKPD